MGEAKRRRDRGEGPRSRTIPEEFIKGWDNNFYFGTSEPPEPVRISAEIATAQGHPFVPSAPCRSCVPIPKVRRSWTEHKTSQRFRLPHSRPTTHLNSNGL